jgi:hypothetical protein
MTTYKYDRYSELINNIIEGSYYDSYGVVIPLRFDATQLRLETTEANTVFNVAINNNASGIVTTDSEGNAIFSRKLPQGEVIIILSSTTSLKSYTTYLTVRDYAIWLATYAESLENIDKNIQQTRDNISLETAELEAITTNFGENVKVYADLGQGIEAYRQMVAEIRSAYRNQGGTLGGLNAIIRSFTQVEPFGYLRRYSGPNWVLDQSFLVNHRFLKRSAQISTTGNITGVSIESVEPSIASNPSTAHSLIYNATAETLQWVPDGSSGVAQLVKDGEMFLSGTQADFAHILGRDASSIAYNIVLGTNDTLALNIDFKGVLEFQLTTGLPNPTPANVLTDVQAALTSDVRYGSAYASLQSLYNGRLLLKSDTGLNQAVEILSCTNNAAGDIFGVNIGDINYGNKDIFQGISLQYISGGSDKLISTLGTCNFDYVYSASTFTIRWQAPGAAYGSYVALTEMGDYTLQDGDGNIANIHVDYDDLLESSSTASRTLSYYKKSDNLNQLGGISILVDKEQLPSTDQTDTITLYDDVTDGYAETPDYWYFDSPSGSLTTEILTSDIIDDRFIGTDPATAFKLKAVDSSATSLTLIGLVKKNPISENELKGTNYPITNLGMFYDYENYDVKFSCWLKTLGAGTTTAVLSLSFDGGTTWVSGSSTNIGIDTGASSYAESTYCEFETPIPTDITIDATTGLSALVKIEVAKASANMEIEFDAPNLQIKYISSGYLGNATVVRDDKTQYLGGLLWVWNREPLTIKEKKYLGIRHTSSNILTPYAGVTIGFISDDTPVGKGTLEYSYTSSGFIKKLRWIPNGTSYATGVGWVKILSDGTYTLTAPDSSYITVDCTYSILPVENKTKDITISDETVEQGQTRRISPTTFDLDILDATEYDVSNQPINLIGVIDESDFSLCGLINTDIAESDPFKYSYAFPEFDPFITGERLTFSTVGANEVAALVNYSDMNMERAVLLEDGIPVSNDLWSFSDYDEIVIPTVNFTSGALSYSSIFTIDYSLIYQVTTPILDLATFNPNYTDYGWWADYALVERNESVQGSYLATTPIYFSVESGKAFLENRSDSDKSTAILKVQQAQEVREIPKRYWRFLNDFTLSIDKAFLAPGQYFLEHTEAKVYEQYNLEVVFEHRSGTTTANCESDTWVEISKNETLDIFQASPHIYHQLRISISNLRSVKDFKLRSMVIKGLNLRGSSASVPGLTSLWKGVV